MAYTCRTVFFFFVNLLIKINNFVVALFILLIYKFLFFSFTESLQVCDTTMCDSSRSVFMLLFAHKAKPWKEKKKKALFVGLGNNLMNQNAVIIQFSMLHAISG